MREMNIKGIVTKIVLGALLAGAVWLAAPKTVRADVTLGYEESTQTISWTDDSIKKIKIGDEELTPSGDKQLQLSYAQLHRAVGDVTSAGSKTGTVILLGEDGSRIDDGKFSVEMYAADITNAHGSIVTTYPDPGEGGTYQVLEYGFKDEPYRAVWSQTDKYALKEWTDDHSTALTRTNLVFGTGYAVDTVVPTAKAYSTSELSGNPTAESQTLSVTLDPGTANPELLSFEKVSDPEDCNITFTVSNGVVTFNSVTGNGEYGLKVFYGTGAEKQQIDTKNLKIKTIVTWTITPEPMEVPKGSTQVFTITVTPAGSLIAGTYSSSVDLKGTSLKWSAKTATGGKLTVDATKTTGAVDIPVNFSVGSGDDKQSIPKTVKVTSGGGGKTVISVDIEGPDEVTAGTNQVYKATVMLEGNVESKKGVTWSVENVSGAPGTTITSAGELKTKKTDLDGRVMITAVSKEDNTSFDSIYVDLVDVIYLTSDLEFDCEGDDGIIRISTGYKLNLGWKKGATGDPENASVDVIKYTPDDVKVAKEYLSINNNYVIVPKKKTKEGSEISLAPTVIYRDGNEDEGFSPISIAVVDDWASSLSESDTSSSTKSDYHLTLKFLNDEVYTGYDTALNLTGIDGYRVDVMYKGKSVASEEYEMKNWKIGSSYNVLDKDDMNELLKEASGSLSGDSPEVEFWVSPIGTNQEGDDDTVNTDAAKKIKRKVYKDGSYYYVDDKKSSSSSGSTSRSSGTGANGGTGGNGLDKVPKTGEGNTRLLIIMTAVIFATIAGSILLSYMPAKSAHGIGHFHTADSRHDAAMQGFFGGWKGEGEDKKTDQIEEDEFDPDDWSRES